MGRSELDRECAEATSYVLLGGSNTRVSLRRNADPSILYAGKGRSSNDLFEAGRGQTPQELSGPRRGSATLTPLRLCHHPSLFRALARTSDAISFTA